MHADLSRWTFQPEDSYRAVLLQQGRVLLDADWNEQTQITARHDETRTRDIIGPAGGPLDGAGFAIVDTAGADPSGAAWADLRVTPGRYYVDGVLAEAVVPVAGGAGHPLADQPYLRAVGDLPGLPEPTANGRYALVLDVWSHHVTADESPDLLESALGGPDTTTRLRTVWQVRVVPVEADATCADVVDPEWGDRDPPTLTASLQVPDPTADPCLISSAGGYQRLENQLYRVEIHELEAGPHYLWSRENGSVVASLVAIGPPSATAAAAGMDAELTLDRVGRDEELSISEGDIVEVTSADRQLHRRPGTLATAGAPDGLALPVQWLDTPPGSVTALGSTPIVRRWEGPPRPATGTDELEDGLRVQFGAGDFRVGDHWLIPARTVRLVYGVSALSGTIEWPVDALGDPAAQPPLGPLHHVAPLALLDRATSGGDGVWTLVSDCRRLTPWLTDLVTIDLLGGDGQAAPPGVALPEPVRVVVRNGGVAVPGASVRFTTVGGHLASGVPTAASPATLTFSTDAHGQADIRWLLSAGGPDTQVLTARRLDDAGVPVDAEVRVTGRREAAGGDTSVCVVIRPDTDLVRLFRDLSGVSSLVLCFTAGTWELHEPAVLEKVGTVIVGGAGAATRILSSAETALRFVECDHVTVRDLHAEALPEASETSVGTLMVLQGQRVHIERVSTVVSGGPAPTLTGIMVASNALVIGGGRRALERVVVRDCVVAVGDDQTGILVMNGVRTDITGCEVSAIRPAGLVGPNTLRDWLRVASFAQGVARRAAHALDPTGGRELGPRTGRSTIVEATGVRFGTEIAQPDRWRAYLEGVPSSIEAVQNRIQLDLTSRNPSAPFFEPDDPFSDWLDLVAADLAAEPAAGFGIRVRGAVADDVRIVDNTVRGALQSIAVALVMTENGPGTVERLQIHGNTIDAPLRAAIGVAEPAIDIGDCRHLSAATNVVTQAEGKASYAVEGLRFSNRPAVHAVAFANTFVRAAHGIRLLTSPEPAGLVLRVARDNICTDGPVLVDPGGTWRDEGNVGTP